MMYAVSVAFRASCHDLMTKTAIVCDAIADELAPPPTNWAKVLVDLVDKAIDVVTFVFGVLAEFLDDACSAGT
jgi:hypothetical protein